MSKNNFKSVTKQQKKIKVLAYCDAPVCATGFGSVSRNILQGLYNTGRYEIEILSINYWGDPHTFPAKLWPVGTNQERDPYGRSKIAKMIPQMQYDILFFFQDTFILNFLPELIKHLQLQGKNQRSVVYFPIDGEPKEQWIHNVNACDYLVAYTNFGKEAAKRVCPVVKPIQIITHGVNTSDYFVVDKTEIEAFRKQYFGKVADKFIFTSVARNQQRKDIPRTIAAFAEFRKQVKDSVLYLHCASKDQGWDLPEVIKSYGLNTTEDIILPQNFGPNQGYPRQIVNLIYNASDCVVGTATGEGWGNSWIESMAVKTPVIMPANTAFVENINEDNGYLVKSGTSPSLFTVLPNDNQVIRPLVKVEDMVEKMLDVYNNPEEAKRRAENAYNWVTMKMDWQKNVVPQWVELFDKVYEEMQSGDTNTVEGDKVISTEKF